MDWRIKQDLLGLLKISKRPKTEFWDEIFWAIDVLEFQIFDITSVAGEKKLMNTLDL